MHGIGELFIVAGLALARAMPVAFLVPAFGGQAVPAQVRTGIGLALAMLAAPHLAGVAPPGGHALLLVLLLRELLVGVTFGFVASLVFRAAEMAGRLVDTVRGANVGEVLTPAGGGERSSPTGVLYLLLATVIFLEMGGLAHLAVAIGRSYEVVPLALARGPTGGEARGLLTLLLVTTGGMIEAALGLAAPIIVAAFMTDLVLGLIARLVPQLPVYFVGLPAKGLLGLGVLLLSLGAIKGALQGAFAAVPALLGRVLAFW